MADQDGPGRNAPTAQAAGRAAGRAAGPNTGGTDRQSDGAPHWLLCNCEGSATVDGAALTQALGPAVAPQSAAVGSSLCAREQGTARALIAAAQAKGRPIGVACAQEAETFREIAQEVAQEIAEEGAAAGGEVPAPLLIADIRDRAAWSAEAAADPAAAAPKMAALLAEAALPAVAPKALEVISDGMCLVVGRAETVLPAAERLSERLSVTALVTDPEGTDFSVAGALSPRPGLDRGRAGFDVAAGRISRASGALGRFSLRIDRFAERRPGGRGGLDFGPRRDGAETECDILLDLTGEPSLFPAPEKRDGYVRADPGDPLTVERALFDASDLSGAFDKTLHIAFEASLCAHSRARQPGCDRCLSVCPAGAIMVPDGSDHVAIDPHICAGCGACAAVCPSGAARYDAPPFERQAQRLRTMIEAYRRAAPERPGPRLLLHDREHGAEMIRLAARYGAGLPLDLIPLELGETTEAGHALALAAFGLGYRGVAFLAGPKTEKAALGAQIALTRRLLSECGLEEERLALVEETDPDAFAAALADWSAPALERPRILALGEQRTVARQALAALAAEGTGALDLAPPTEAAASWPAGGAPYGAVLVDTDSCTLCLSCVSLCPSGALADNPDRPELRFQEDACLQCGICASACPEDAITYQPRFNLAPAALAFETLHAEEPFACVECGKLFGVKSTIERVAEKLGGAHWMYTDSDNLRLIQMCDDCRVNAQFHAKAAPFQMGDRPRVRTTADYMAERETPPGGKGSGEGPEGA